MDVYFGENFWGKSRGEMPGKKISVGKTFTWSGRKWSLPAVYLFEEGITADFCVHVPLDEIESFVSKWNHGEEMSKFSDEEMEEMERENPFSSNYNIEMYLNGQKMENMGRSGIAWHPLHLEGEAVDSLSEMLMETYECSRDAGWEFVRVSFRYPDVQPEKIKIVSENSGADIIFQFERNPVFYPGPHFTAGIEDVGKCIELVHPETGRKHILTIGDVETHEMEYGKPVRMLGRRLRNIPTKYLMMRYTLEPDLPLEQFRVQDCQKSDAPETNMDSQGAVAISVIGGADGPVSFFAAGRKEEEDTLKNEKTVCSALHYEAVDRTEWRTSFQMTGKESKEIHVILKA